jgi:hypothetical protein
MRSRVVKRAIAASPTTIKHKRDARQFKAWTVAALLEQYRDPRAILLEIASMETATLAKQMNGTLADALAERRLCAQAVLPYVAQKLPAQIDMRLTRAINLNIVDDTQYQELANIAAEATDEDRSFNMQLLPNATEDSTNGSSTDLAGNETPAQQLGAATGETPVTPPAPAPAKGEQ